MNRDMYTQLKENICAGKICSTCKHIGYSGKDGTIEVCCIDYEDILCIPKTGTCIRWKDPKE